MISIITATKNSKKLIENLANSLRNQSFRNFEWVVADGNSTDGTIEYLKSIDDLKVNLLVRDDFGIYDALNFAIQHSKFEYYIVVGSDDIFYPNALDSFWNSYLESKADFVLQALDFGSEIVYPAKGLGWLRGMNGIASSHSVGSMIRKSLHNQFGYYSNKYSIVADQFFIKQAIYGGASVYRGNTIVGRMGNEGYSSSNLIDFLTQFFSVQIKTEKSKFLQILLHLIRLIRYYRQL
ncbi:glycosyltransferase [Leptospira sp. 201903075]|uniref:glycosyltransferase n=1 Tax=Leptospira chreensis TaxID=2810035 RepID=UPI001965CC98|nr:glycosyltransferase [Leptospira chreensis]MBM9589045.1 glycosyltransferase [Leptospira chreensis]